MPNIPANLEELTPAAGVEQSDRLVSQTKTGVRVVKGAGATDPRRRTRSQQISDLRNSLRRLDEALIDEQHVAAGGKRRLDHSDKMLFVPEFVALMFEIFHAPEACNNG